MNLNGNSLVTVLVIIALILAILYLLGVRVDVNS